MHAWFGNAVVGSALAAVVFSVLVVASVLLVGLKAGTDRLRIDVSQMSDSVQQIQADVDLLQADLVEIKDYQLLLLDRME